MARGNEPATKQDLTELEDRMVGRMRESEDRVVETMRDIQTEMLKAFYSFAESNRQRVTQF
jgi:hypothetical protein